MVNYSDKKQDGESIPDRTIWKYLKKIPDNWRYCLIVWAIFRTFLTFWGWLMWKTGWLLISNPGIYYYDIRPINIGWRGALFGVWMRWDAIHYLRIADKGYYDIILSAFFPLFPMSGRATAELLGQEMVVGLILVSNISLILATVLLYGLTKEIVNREVAEGAVIALYIHPSAVFWFAPYTESIALFLILLTYIAIRRKKWYLGMIAGIATGLSRGTVFPLVALLFLEVLRNRRELSIRELVASAAIVASPVIGTGSFLVWRSLKGFPPYDVLLDRYWGRYSAFPLQEILAVPETIRKGLYPPSGYVNLILLIMVISISIWMARRLPSDLVIFQFIALAFTLSTTITHEPLASWGRYSLIIFPTYIGLSLWARTPRHKLWIFSVFAALMLFTASQFFLWGWVG